GPVYWRSWRRGRRLHSRAGGADPGAHPQPVPYGRYLRKQVVRLRLPAAPCHAAGGGGRQRRPAVHAPGRARHWPAGQATSLPTPEGRRARHGRGESAPRLWSRPATLWHRRADPRRSWRAADSPPDEQSEEGGWLGWLRFAYRGARADSGGAERREPALPA